MKDFLIQFNEQTDNIFNDIEINERDMEILINKINSIKKEFLFKSNFHGLYHSEKVLLFSYLIGKAEKLNDVEMEIIMDAAIYHDIGRNNENEDTAHGFASSCRLDSEKGRILSNTIYEDNVTFTYLKAICDAHSMPDDKEKRIFDNYNYEEEKIEYEQFHKLSDILKDADALDRTRFASVNPAALKESFLRNESAKKLVGFAKYINGLYREREINEAYPKFNSIYGKKEEILNEQSCFHGIGADFFKLESILTNGILSSYSRKKQNLETSSNFNGSNGSLWISVVDSSLVSKNGNALQKYIQSGISFYCFIPKFKVSRDTDYIYADVQNKGEYSDEKYVFDRIEKEQIHSVLLPNDMLSRDVSTLNYLICATNYEIICNTIKYYKLEMKKHGYFKNIDDSVVNKILNDFFNEQVKYDQLNYSDKELFKNEYFQIQDDRKAEINAEVQKWFKEFYAFILNKNTSDYITVIEVVDHIMKQFDVKGMVLPNDNKSETIIILNPLKLPELEDNKVGEKLK